MNNVAAPTTNGLSLCSGIGGNEPGIERVMSGERYGEFLRSKMMAPNNGASIRMANGSHSLFDFQKELVEWGLSQKRSAIFADCGLGKTPMQLIWADSIVKQTNKKALIVTPLAVGHQTLREADKFCVEACLSSDGTFSGNIVVTNYERLHYFNPSDFIAIVCDESSILKNFNGVRKAMITEFMRTIPYRLLCTATAAPNDYIELGTSSEALGYLGYMDMLHRFFAPVDKGTFFKRSAFESSYDGGWRFKGHAEQPFWQWVASWARALRSPSDMGYSDDLFRLPPLEVRQTVVETKVNWHGQMFPKMAETLSEQRKERRATLPERCEAAAQAVSHDKPAVIWCHLNDEGDLLERIIPGSVQVKGADPDEKKENSFHAFANGDIRVLITKPKIGGFGLNWQHCAHVVYFVSHSYEQYYQAIRRCWRFGQQSPVTVDAISSEGDIKVLANLQRKAEAADEMFSSLTSNMYDAIHINPLSEYSKSVEVPSWL